MNMDGHKEIYEITIIATQIDLHDTANVKRYIEDHIANAVRQKMNDFRGKYGTNPQVIRLASSDFDSMKEAMQREQEKSWITGKDLKIDGIQVEATCRSGRGKVVMEFWEGIQDDEPETDEDDS
jgi:hypothetical protein